MDFLWTQGSASLNLVSLILAVVGILASLYFYLKSIRVKRPVFLIRTFHLVKDYVGEIDGLSILFHDKPIKSLSFSRVAFWNAGRETVNRADLLTKDPLRIQSGDASSILGAKLSYARRATNDLECRVQDGQALILFEYLDERDGCVVDVYHTGSAELSVAGTIKGCAAIVVADTATKYFQRMARFVESLPEPRNPFLNFLAIGLSCMEWFWAPRYSCSYLLLAFCLFSSACRKNIICRVSFR